MEPTKNELGSTEAAAFILHDHVVSKEIPKDSPLSICSGIPRKSLQGQEDKMICLWLYLIFH
jgi:hypothetical protein